MVAYSFKKRFAPLIADGRKTQTIRAGRARHARVGELVQLYVGMRTSGCLKIIPDPVCVAVSQIEIHIAPHLITYAVVDGQIITISDQFAILDGFENANDMHRFWIDTHGEGVFRGVVIDWSAKLPLVTK